MNAPLPRPSTIIASGSRQQSEEKAAPSHAAAPAPTDPSLIASPGPRRARDPRAPLRSPRRQPRDRAPWLLHFLGGERAVLERQPVALTAALDEVSRLRGIGERQQFVAV